MIHFIHFNDNTKDEKMTPTETRLYNVGPWFEVSLRMSKSTIQSMAIYSLGGRVL